MFDGALPNHFATPPWLEQRPAAWPAFDQVLSAQRAVAVFGMRISFFAFAPASLGARSARCVWRARLLQDGNCTLRRASVRIELDQAHSCLCVVVCVWMGPSADECTPHRIPHPAVSAEEPLRAGPTSPRHILSPNSTIQESRCDAFRSRCCLVLAAGDHRRRAGETLGHPADRRPLPRLRAGRRSTGLARRQADRLHPPIRQQDRRPLGLGALDHERRRLAQPHARQRREPGLVAGRNAHRLPERG